MAGVDEEAEVATFANLPTRRQPSSITTLPMSTGWHPTDLAIYTMIISGVVGNAAWSGVVWAIRWLPSRLFAERAAGKRKYVGQIAQLAVAAKLPKRVRTQLVSCQRKGDIFIAVVRAGHRTYRVQFPVDDPQPSSISVDMN